MLDADFIIWDSGHSLVRRDAESVALPQEVRLCRGLVVDSAPYGVER